MNLLKSIFVIAYIMGIAVSGSLYATYHFAYDFSWAWAGTALATLPATLFFMRLMLFKDTPRTAAALPLETALAAAGIALSGYYFAQGQHAQPFVLAIIATLGLLLYTYWYSTLDRRALSALVQGQPLPDFALEDENGIPVSSRQFAASPALWLFYRGNWCPLCMAQIKEIAAQYRALQKRGIEVVLVSPQPHARTRELAQQFDVPFTFLVDRDHRAARQLGIAHSYGTPMGMQLLGYDSETVLPTVVLTDEMGEILLADQTDNYRIRPEPATFLRVFDERVPDAIATA